MNTKLIDVKFTVNGGPVERSVRADKLLVDFLPEDLGLTGTKFSCGIGACGACKVAVQEGPSTELLPVLACFARMNAVDGMCITTVEGLSSGPTLHPLQQAFLDDYAFQCGFSTSGFLMAGYVMLDQLRRKPIPRSKVDQTIVDAIGGHVCRCTGYLRYFEAIRRVVLSTPGVIREEAAIASDASSITFRIVKQSSNDLAPKVLIGRFERPQGSVEFAGGLDFDTCGGSVTVTTQSLATSEPARDLNLARFFFVGAEEIRFNLGRAEPIDRGTPPSDLLGGRMIPMTISGTLYFDVLALPASMEVFVQVMEEGRMKIVSRAPFRFDPRDLGFAVASFAEEFGLKLETEVEVTVDLTLPYIIR